MVPKTFATLRSSRPLQISAGLVLAALLLFGIRMVADTMSKPPELSSTGSQNVLAGTWDFVPGVTRSGNDLRIARTGQAILSFADNTQPGQTETSYVANPPINLYGTHAKLADPNNFGVTATLADMKGKATLSLYSGPSVRYDERIERLPSLDVTIDTDTATVTTYGKPGSKPKQQRFGFDTNGGNADIAVIKDGKKLFVSVNNTNKRIAAGSDAAFENAIWFGVDSTDTYTVTGLRAVPVNGNTVALVDTSKADYIQAQRAASGLIGLATGAGRGDKLIGTAVDLPVLMADPNYSKFIIENFNEIETEMLAKFQALQPEEGKFQFAELDALVDFANKHGLVVHGHALIFGEAYPAWLQAKLQKNDKAGATKLLQDHIQTVVSRYDGKHGHGEIKYWDVVNEPFSVDDMGSLSTYNLWHKALGPDYIKLALQAARTANPNGVFGINENALEGDADRRAGMRSLINWLNPTGGEKLVDFIGFQAHFDEDTLDDVDAMKEFYGGIVQKEFAYYKSIGVDVRYSEVTVAENNDAATKAKVYGQLARECATATNCIGFNLWGATNNTGIYFYNTGNIVSKDAGDDAPTTQQGNDTVAEGPAFRAIKTAFEKP